MKNITFKNQKYKIINEKKLKEYTDYIVETNNDMALLTIRQWNDGLQELKKIKLK